jgi:hypothetical protein
MLEPARGVRWAVRLVVSAGLIAAIGAVAHVPIGSATDHAALRVDLVTRHAKIELCRDRTDDELSGLPAHMRQRRDCSEIAVDYHLRITIDGEVRADRPIVHRGVRRNRPLIAEEMLAVPAGRHRVEIEFSPTAPTGQQADLSSLPSHRFSRVIPCTAGRIEIVHLEEGELVRIDA